MAFRALLFSKSPETNAAMKAACESTGIRAHVSPDIFTAIEKGKTRAFSCVIADWADQPEAGFLLKRARESGVNRETVAVAIVDNEPTAAEMRDNRLDFLIYRPISVEEADAVLAKACERMRPLSAEDAASSSESSSELSREAEAGRSVASGDAEEGGHSQENSSADSPEANAADGNSDAEIATEEYGEAPRAH